NIPKLLPQSFEEASETKYQGGHFWTPITPIQGSNLHAGSQASFSRSQRAGAPTLFRQPLYPTPDRRPADTKLPNGVIDATFQTASPIEICLNKRT
ncbi:hypothetical protein, partial [Sedimentitalea xiamensis]|uniref:hypothetical protein n=1 Tax=Sedimentitalea xiamensis TaxID=3050037 RepID=UPI003899D5D9